MCVLVCVCACKRTLKLNDKSLVRWQKQTVAKQFVVKCKLKANDEEADDDGDGDTDASDDVSSYGEPETEPACGEGGDEKIKVPKRPRERESGVHRPLRANGVELSQMYELHLSVLGTN